MTRDNQLITLITKIGFVFSTSENLFKHNQFNIQDERELDVFHSTKSFWVLIQEFRIDNEFMIKFLKPYKVCNTKEELLFGWSDGLNTWDNFYNSIHEDNNPVISFLP